ncbi:hypothetical protein [Sphaerisporangium corydalis]|uniref:Uncharacterized protein n=1 Tax=Sphaerisporangium corydalis TaxID=1441875 RepID=A0ABV9EEJ7_9ACTN|nr:hypothetical protein [Sphaerisporangium corydalis]
MIPSLRGSLRTAAGLAALLLAAVPATAAGADAAATTMAAAHVTHAPPVLNITITPQGFTVPGPNPRPSGLTTFRVETAETTGMWLALIRPKADATWEQVVKSFDDLASPDAQVRLQGLRDQYRYTDFAGGVSVFAGRPVTFTEKLDPGRYYLVGTSMQGGAHLETLDVTDERAPAVPPRIDGIIYVTEVAGRPRLILPPRLPATGTFLVRNDSSLPQEFIFVRVPSDATYQTVQAYFDAVRGNTALPPNPLLETTAGMLAISPGRTALIHADFTPGRYSILSFLMEPENGIKQAYLGLHREFTFSAS